jgi:hypothetical protein
MSVTNDYKEQYQEELQEEEEKLLKKIELNSMLIELKNQNIAWFEYHIDTESFYDFINGDYWAKDEIIELYRQKILSQKVLESQDCYEG